MALANEPRTTSRRLEERNHEKTTRRTTGSCGAALSPATSAAPSTRKRPAGQGDRFGFFATTGLAAAMASTAIRKVSVVELISLCFDGAAWRWRRVGWRL